MNKEQEARIARSIFSEPCIGKNTRYHGGNCVHCCLRGDGLANTADGKGLEPNYSGWERLYVQAGRDIPARFEKAFVDRLLANDNPAYITALAEDIKHYGATIDGKPV